MLTLVVARYNEPLDWLSHVWRANVVVINKSEIGNVGREASSYLWFIANNYDSLKGDYLFCQGNPFDHCANFLNVIGKQKHYGLVCQWPECHANSPHLLTSQDIEDLVDQIRYFSSITIDVDLSRFYFVSGAQFMASAEEIKFRPKHFYETLLAIVNATDRSPWACEALWGHIIPAVRLEVTDPSQVHFGRK